MAAKKAPAKKVAKAGRPSKYSEAVASTTCERLAGGESLRSICQDATMPSMTSVFRWLADPERAAFREQYAHAREEQAETLADEIVEIADEQCTMVRASKHPGAKADDDECDIEVVFDATAVARNRLRVEARKWVASKLKPKKYGDRTTLAGDADAPVQVAHSGSVAIDAAEAYRLLINGK